MRLVHRKDHGKGKQNSEINLNIQGNITQNMGGILNNVKKDGLSDNVIEVVTNHLKKIKLGPILQEFNM